MKQNGIAGEIILVPPQTTAMTTCCSVETFFMISKISKTVTPVRFLVTTTGSMWRGATAMFRPSRIPILVAVLEKGRTRQSGMLNEVGRYFEAASQIFSTPPAGKNLGLAPPRVSLSLWISENMRRDFFHQHCSRLVVLLSQAHENFLKASTVAPVGLNPSNFAARRRTAR